MYMKIILTNQHLDIIHYLLIINIFLITYDISDRLLLQSMQVTIAITHTPRHTNVCGILCKEPWTLDYNIFGSLLYLYRVVGDKLFIHVILFTACDLHTVTIT